MNILVLSASKSLNNDKTEYSSGLFNCLENGGNEVTVEKISPRFPGLSLKKAVKREPKPDLILIPSDIKNDRDFRSKFAFIINYGEQKVQDIPDAKEKINIKESAKRLIGKLSKKEVNKEKREPEYVKYNKKKTRVFKSELNGKPIYTFSYIGSKIAVIPEYINPEDLKDLPEFINRIYKENDEEYPDGYLLSEKTLKVTTFSERHFPVKGDSKEEIIRKSVKLTAACVFLAAGVLFVYNMFVMPAQQQALQSEIRTVFYEDSGGSSSSAVKKNKTLNWKKLKKINKDIKGWIRVNHTKIDYPVLQSKSDNKDKQFYLNHNYLKQYTPRGFGAIFVDYRSKKGMKSKNIVLHGHHMEDGTMFGDLMKYGRYTGNLGFYKKSPVIKLSTPKGGTKTYKIFSVFKSNVNTSQGEYFDFYCAKFKSKAQFMNYVYNLRIRSLFDCPVNVNENDQLLTLVTCSYEFNGFRTVVVARKCRDGESAKVDTSEAKLNKNPVWPQCYYSRFSGKRPTVLTFKKARKKGYIHWYDGNSKLKGSEQLPTSFTKPTQPTTAAETSKPTEPTTAKPTKPPKIYYKVKITKYNKHGKKKIIRKKVEEGTEIKLPKVPEFEKKGYKYTFKKWRVKGFKGRKFLSKKYDKVKVFSDIKMAARYKKTKIKADKPKTVKKPAKNSDDEDEDDDSDDTEE